MKWKEMPENGKKLVMILMFVFIMFFVSGCMYGKAYASTKYDASIQAWPATYDMVKASYGDYYVMLDNGNQYYECIIFKNPMTVSNTDQLNMIGTNMKWKKYQWNGSIWQIIGDYNTSQYQSYNFGTIYGSNHDIIKYETGAVFFSPPKLLLPNQIQHLHLSQVMDQVVSVFPILLVCLIGYLGLRKGLSILQAILHQA